MAMQWSPQDWARVGRQLRTWREASGFSRRELSELAGVSEKSIQLAEEGRVPKGRWPQSLTAIERALGFPPGRIEAMLDASDDPHVYDDPVVMRDGRTVMIDAKTMEPMGASSLNSAPYDVGQESEDKAKPFAYPPEIEEALPVVMFFASNCVAHGAPEWLGAAFDNAVTALLKSLSDGASGRPPAASTARVTRERPGYSLDNPGLRITKSSDALRRSLTPSKNVYDAMTKLSRDLEAHQAALRKFVGSSSELQKFARESEEFGKSLARMSTTYPTLSDAYRRSLGITRVKNGAESQTDDASEFEENPDE